MISSFWILPLASALMNGPVSANNLWQIDYDKAKQSAIALHKPMAVIVGEGQEGWKQLTIEHSISESIDRVLSDNYVCLYVDKTTEAGKLLADKLDVSNSTGLVISDRETRLQAFSHNGVIGSTDLLGVLNKYSATNLPVTRTENLDQVNTLRQTAASSTGELVQVAPGMPVPNTKQATYVPYRVAPMQYPYPVQSNSCPNGNCPKTYYP